MSVEQAADAEPLPLRQLCRLGRSCPRSPPVSHRLWLTHNNAEQLFHLELGSFLPVCLRSPASEQQQDDAGSATGFCDVPCHGDRGRLPPPAPVPRASTSTLSTFASPVSSCSATTPAELTLAYHPAIGGATLGLNSRTLPPGVPAKVTLRRVATDAYASA
uniref:Uncharacterized protein n=1 Tax=Zea mays TaxID=4577 RepID=A0A804LZQ5_MAIZE